MAAVCVYKHGDTAKNDSNPVTSAADAIANWRDNGTTGADYIASVAKWFKNTKGKQTQGEKNTVAEVTAVLKEIPNIRKRIHAAVPEHPWETPTVDRMEHW